MRANKVHVDLGKLDELLKKLDSKYTIRVGIIGKEGSKKHKGTDLTMASLGAIHEFGATINVTPKMRAYLNYNGIHLKSSTTSIVIPTRSFLRMPLMSDEGKKEIIKGVTQSLKFDNNTEIIENLDPKTLATAIGAEAYKRVMEAFETNGFGNWAPLSMGVFAKKYEAGIKDYNKRLRQMEKGKIDYNPELLDKKLQDAMNPHMLVDTGALQSSIDFEIKEQK